MAGSTASKINLIVDRVKYDLANATTLGVASSNIYERDENPAIPANEGRLPALYVVPLVEGKDSFDFTMGARPVSYHTFPINIIAYYEMPDIYDSLRTVRDYAYNCVDVFLADQALCTSPGQIVGGTLETGYYVVVDRIIHYWIVVLNIKTIL